MNYRVFIVGPSGMTRYLRRGRECETGTIYSSPSAARRAADRYLMRKNWKVPPIAFVINKDGDYVD